MRRRRLNLFMEQKTQLEIKKIEKVIVNTGLGKLRNNAQFEDKLLPEVMKELALITGQKPAPRKAKKSIAGFKTRTGDIIGLQVTIRGKRMADFLKRTLNVVFPRVKDFRGLELTCLDGSGNLNIGFKEQFVFPEINIEQSKVNFGLQITIVPKIRNLAKAIDLYRSIGIPFKR